MGRGQLLDRLTEQMRTQKNPPSDPRATAIAVLQKRGQLKNDGKTFTIAGHARNNMTAEQRALDRAAKRTGLALAEFSYDPQTNKAKKKYGN